jgi:hypothetical protein
MFGLSSWACFPPTQNLSPELSIVIRTILRKPLGLILVSPPKYNITALMHVKTPEIWWGDQAHP